ncbi:MAG: hypothetical protein IKG82_06325 [Oscillospiraceae bacterium]|nr:hypothetical protein [Oscillospiraceae bacterium]
MKKLLSCMLAGILAVQGLGGSAFAGASGTIRVGSAEAEPGTAFDLPVEITENPGLAALSLELTYDASKLELVSVTDCKILGSSVYLGGKDMNLVPYTMNWDDLADTNNTGTGNVAVLSFKAKEDASGSTEVKVAVNQRSTFNIDLTEVPFTAESGTVTFKRAAQPAVTTAAPATTAKPVVTTAAPATTVKPVVTTAAPATTAKPVVTTAAPATTAKPVVTTAAAPATTVKPVATTAAAPATTAKPVATTAAATTRPAATTQPVSTSGSAVTTTAPAETEVPIVTTVYMENGMPVIDIVSPYISGDTKEAKVGEKVKMPINLKNNPGVAALSLNVSYDKTKLKLLGAEDGKILGSSTFLAGNDLTLVPYTLNWDDLAAENNTGNGVVATLEFEVLAEGTIPVEIALNQRSTFNVDLKEVGFATGAGTIIATVPPKALKGDADLNGTVSVEDVQIALKAYTENFAGKGTGLSAAAEKNADVNEDGELSIDDVQNILIYYVKNTVAGLKITWEELIPELKKQA